MTLKERIKYILRKHPETRFSRGLFMWAYCVEYLGINIGLSREQFLEFWKDEASVERVLRDILKENEFKLDPKSDSKRYEKSAQFRQDNLIK